ncbi:hypothetical protein EPYR_02656 [Erwinia pyrifoliae DSM 12163]|nr:hypothetical protein EPYR_02656 [Erwinia pyrifoliae DSM 12163]
MTGFDLVLAAAGVSDLRQPHEPIAGFDPDRAQKAVKTSTVRTQQHEWESGNTDNMHQA